ncbi:F-box domain protein [Mucor ambiguus]|uniref:F-box domain protein n=1 Tax=Mucor ambiguus TaxID=91626 RepID=A0A0C9N857_9FUNG|nr:F-box domain protein [Mucor ambiguus]GAN10803.1 F-box domain protein [Mucor ambiguus]
MYKRKQTAAESSKAKQPKLTAINSSGELWKQVFFDANTAFRENKFKESVSLFNRALGMNPNHITIMDCRAAAYEKLNELDHALKDALSIIKLAPKEARGYLRAGKVLSLQQKHKQAVSVYKRASTRVDPQDKRYSQIKSMLIIAEKKASPPPSFDFMKILPYDVISLIFSMLSFDRRIQCTGVSQTWRGFALGWSGMWRDLDFGDRKVSYATIKKYLGYAKGRHVRRIAMIDADQSRMKKILQLLIDANCQYIEVLDFVRCEIPTVSLSRMLRLVGKHVNSMRLDECDIQVATVFKEVLPRCALLAHLSMLDIETGNMEDLRQNTTPFLVSHLRLSISGEANLNWILAQCRGVNVLEVKTADVPIRDAFITLMTMPCLKEMYYTVGSNYRVNTRWPLTDKTTAKPGLEIYHICGDMSFTGDLLDGIIRKEFKSLKHLSMLDCGSMDTTLARLVMDPGLPCLEVLNIDKMIVFEEWNLHTIISLCPTIQELSMSWNSGVTDNVLSDIQTVTKKLRKLDLSHCTSITGVGLQQVVQAHRETLEKIKLNNCQRISSDAIRWVYDVLGRRVVECKYDN